MPAKSAALTVLLGLLVLGQAAATCPDFAAWLRPENEVRTGCRARARVPLHPPVPQRLLLLAGRLEVDIVCPSRLVATLEREAPQIRLD